MTAKTTTTKMNAEKQKKVLKKGIVRAVRGRARAPVQKKELKKELAEVAPPSRAAGKASEERTKERFFAGVGRRKTAVARVQLFTKGDKLFSVNDRLLDAFFGNNRELIAISAGALERMKVSDKFRVVVKVRGGGSHAQAEAIRHGSARALTLFNPDFRKRLKRAGFLTRDSRMVERKKYGLKKARRAPQWQKR